MSAAADHLLHAERDRQILDLHRERRQLLARVNEIEHQLHALHPSVYPIPAADQFASAVFPERRRTLPHGRTNVIDMREQEAKAVEIFGRTVGVMPSHREQPASAPPQDDYHSKETY